MPNLMTDVFVSQTTLANIGDLMGNPPPLEDQDTAGQVDFNGIPYHTK